MGFCCTACFAKSKFAIHKYVQERTMNKHDDDKIVYRCWFISAQHPISGVWMECNVAAEVTQQRLTYNCLAYSLVQALCRLCWDISFFLGGLPCPFTADLFMKLFPVQYSPVQCMEYDIAAVETIIPLFCLGTRHNKGSSALQKNTRT